MLDNNIHNNDPLKRELLDMLRKIREEQISIRKELESITKSQSTKTIVALADTPLKLFIRDKEELAELISRLSLCTTTRDWAQQGVYPLYEDGVITAEILRSKRFIEATLPHCKHIPTANYDTLRKQLDNCYFPVSSVSKRSSI